MGTKGKGVINYDIIDGPVKDRILDVFKYEHETKIEISFILTESENQPPDKFYSKIEHLGTADAVVDRIFIIDSIEYAKEDKYHDTLRLTGNCEIFYLDENGERGWPIGDNVICDAAYHVNFEMLYNTDTQRGKMICFDDFWNAASSVN